MLKKFFVDHEDVKQIFLGNIDKKNRKVEPEKIKQKISVLFRDKEYVELLEIAKTWSDQQKDMFFPQIIENLPDSLMMLAQRIQRDSNKKGIYDDKENVVIDSVRLRGVGGYVSHSRIKGFVDLLFITKEDHEYVHHYFKIAFNYKGVYHYHQERFRTIKDASDEIDFERFWSIGFQNCLGLLKDGYTANLKYQSNAEVQGKENPIIHFAMSLDNQQKDNSLIIPLFLDEREAIYGYIKAVTNEDGYLDYDLSSQQRKMNLGNRDAYAIHWNHELQGYQVLNSEIIELVEEDGVQSTVRLTVIDEQHQVLVIYMKINMVKEDQCYKIDRILVLDGEKILPNGQHHPANGWVYVSVIAIHNQQQVIDQMLAHPDIQIGGEIKESVLLKYVRRNTSLEIEMNIAEKIPLQFLISKYNVVIFSYQPMVMVKCAFEWSGIVGNWKNYLGRGKIRMKDVYGLEDKQILNELIDKHTSLYYVDGASMRGIYRYCLQENFEAERFGDDVLMLCKEDEQGCVAVRFNQTFGLIQFIHTELNEFFLEQLELGCILPYEDAMNDKYIRSLINHCIWKDETEQDSEYKQYRNKYSSCRKGKAKIYVMQG